MKIKLIFVMLTVLTLATLARAGTIIYDNGAPNQQSGNEMTEFVQTEDFTLTSPRTLTDIHFWDIETTAAYSGSILYFISGDTGGNPDFNKILTIGITSAVTHTLTANGCNVLGFCEYSNDFTTLGVFSLAAGVKYHLWLHNGDLGNTTRSGMYWETTNPNGTQTGLECDLGIPSPCFTSWTNNGQEHAFYLTGRTPEPGTLVMLGAGFLGLAGTLRRKLVK